MSVSAMAWAFDISDLSAGEKLTLLGLANYADENGFCYPSIKRLSQITCQCERTVKQHLTKLTEAGFVTRERTRMADGKLGNYTYQIQPGAKSASGDNQVQIFPKPGAKSAPLKPLSITVKNNITRAREKLPDGIPDDLMRYKAATYWQELGRDDLDVSLEADKFRAHHEAHGKKMADWGAAWRTWYTNAPQFNRDKREGSEAMDHLKEMLRGKS